jgi:hypothetical protein
VFQKISASGALAKHRAQSKARRRAIIGNTPLSTTAKPEAYNRQTGESEI